MPGPIAAGRVVAGSARGIRLLGPGDGTRPLGDRLKEALFAILEPDLRGASFLDLYAGSGAGGIEALSRGAGTATFVDADAKAAGTIRRNLEATRLEAAPATIVRADVRDWLAGSARGVFDAILVDPPYDQPKLLLGALQAIAAAGSPPRPSALLATAGTVVAKHATRTSLPARIGLLASARERRFGDSALTFYRWSAEEAG